MEKYARLDAGAIRKYFSSKLEALRKNVERLPDRNLYYDVREETIKDKLDVWEEIDSKAEIVGHLLGKFKLGLDTLKSKERLFPWEESELWDNVTRHLITAKREYKKAENYLREVKNFIAASNMKIPITCNYACLKLLEETYIPLPRKTNKRDISERTKYMKNQIMDLRKNLDTIKSVQNMEDKILLMKELAKVKYNMKELESDYKIRESLLNSVLGN